jgi:excinuclease ABC subunit B
MTPEQLKVKLKQLEQQMHKHARDLEFEQAAKLRDEILRVRRYGLELPTQEA